MDRKDYLKEQFQKEYGQEPDDLFPHEPSEQELEQAIRLKKDPIAKVGMLMMTEQKLKKLEGKIPDDELRKTCSKHEFNKKVCQARFDMPWSKISDMFFAGLYDELEDAFQEDWDHEDMEKHLTEDGEIT